MANKVIAMILAGGKGTRLEALTKKVAKPLVGFAAKYHIIDFPLSNCANSGISDVGVLCQYESNALDMYLGNGEKWGFNGSHSRLFSLQPRQTEEGASWYSGTADAIAQNIDFLDDNEADYVLILSGDHIYKMDYDKMLDFHKKNNADATIAVLNVTLEEASRFGLMFVNEDGEITEFEEKPKNPKSNLASMGIYVFTWSKLKAYLAADEADPNSENDFGKNVIPAMLNAGEKMQAYRFNGYWKDVGTLESLWDANMDMFDKNSGLNLIDDTWPIYAQTVAAPAAFLGPNSDVTNSAFNRGSVIDGKVKNSVLSQHVTIEPGAEVDHSVILPGVTISRGAKVSYAIIGEDCVIGKNAVVGAKPEETAEGWGLTVLGPDCNVEAGRIIKANRMLDANGKEVVR